MKKKMRTPFIIGIAGMVSMNICMTAFGGSWKQDANGYYWENNNGSRPAGGWEYLDREGDKTYECYYFDENGYLVVNSEIDGRTVNENGAWVVDGQVQTFDYASGTCIAGDKIIRNEMSDYGDASIIMHNFDGSGYTKLFDCSDCFGAQVAYGDSVYLAAQQNISGGDDMYYGVYRIHSDGSVEEIYRSEFIWLMWRIGERIYISSGDEIQYFTPDDYTMRKGTDLGVVFNHGQNRVGVYLENNYEYSDGVLTTYSDDGSLIRSMDISISDGTWTPLCGNDDITVFEYTKDVTDGFLILGSITSYIIIPTDGSEPHLLQDGTFLTYNGNIYCFENKQILYRFDSHGDRETVATLEESCYNYNFEGDCFSYGSGYEKGAVRLPE